MCSGVFSVYMAHAPSGIEFGFWFVLYFASIPLAIIIWAWHYNAYIRKGEYKLRELAVFLLIAAFFTSLASFQLTHMYIYFHSPASTGTCFTGSCVLSDPILERYHIPGGEIEGQGIPSFGIIKGYWMYDTIPMVSPAIPANVRAFVVVRTVPFVPVTDVVVYGVKNGHVTGKKTIRIFWPMQVGKRLTQETGLRFTVILSGVGGGPGA